MRLAPLLIFVGFCLAGCATGKRMDVSPEELAAYQQDQARGLYQVRGSVHYPGTFPMKPGSSIKLADALKKAGGTNPGTQGDDGADLGHIKVMRWQGGTVTMYDVEIWPNAKGAAFLIKAGDHIYVPEVIF